MERITRRLNGGIIEFIDGKGYANLTHEEGIRLLFERLAAYEDTGLLPEEIFKLQASANNRRRLGEKVLQYPKTVGEALNIIRTYGFKSTALDDHLFENARNIVRINNELMKV